MPNILHAPTQRVGQKEIVTIEPDLGGETIADAVWSSLEGGLETSGPAKNDTQASSFVLSPVEGITYAKCVITTSSGRIIPFIVKIPVIALTEE